MAWGLRRPVEHHDWRRSASEDELREYDAFGPWIYNIKAERDTPKRFRAACERHQGARFLLKAPRGVERRDAHPGMDLYVAMLAVHDHGASFMRLTGEGVTVQDLVWDEVAALKSHTNLLSASWTLMLRDGAFSLDYNADASDGQSDRLRPLALVRHGEAPHVLERSGRHRRRPLFPLPTQRQAAQRTAACRADPRRAARPLLPRRGEPPPAFDRRDVPGCARRADHRQSRQADAAFFFESPYAANCIFIPYAGLTSFSLVRPPADRPARFCELALRLDKQVIRQSCLVAPEQVLARLAAHGVPQTSD